MCHRRKKHYCKNEVIKVKKLFDDLMTTSDQKDISTKEQMMEFYVQKIYGQFKTVMSKHVESDFITFDPVADSGEILGQLCVDVNPSEIRNLPKYVNKNETVEFLI